MNRARMGGPQRNLWVWRKRRLHSELGLLALVAGCGGDRTGMGEGAAAVRDTTITVAEAPQLLLEVPDSIPWLQQGDVRVTVANSTGAPLSGARLHLFLQGAVEPVLDSGSDAAARAPVSSPDGARIDYTVGTLASGTTRAWTQRVKMPAQPSGGRGSAGAGLDRFVVRAWLSDDRGGPLGAPVEDTIHIHVDSVAAAVACGPGDAPVSRYGVGAVRLGMAADALRAACLGTRDTSWTLAGKAERGVVVPVGPHQLVAVLARENIQRLRVLRPGLRTAAGVGVGSSLGELRDRYGRTCAGVADGSVSVWFPNAPGIGFAVSAPPPPEWDTATRDPTLLPDTTTVTEMWVRDKSDSCPATAGGDR